MIALNLHSVEELFAGRFSNRDDRGVLHFPFHRNSIEPFLYGVYAADDRRANVLRSRIAERVFVGN